MTDNPHPTLVNYCYTKLREAIIQGEFAPGEKLQIAKLKARLNAGPTPIREALSRLTASGLITCEENKGFRVKSISEIEIRDIYSTFNQIENLALCQAIDLGDASWEGQIVASLYKLSLIEKSNLPTDYSQWAKQNYEFHCTLIAGCNSPTLLKIRENLYQLFDRYCHLSFLLNQSMLPVNYEEHERLAKAALERNKEQACRLTDKHLGSSLKQVIQKLKESKIIT